jgi:hypothetical protein
MRTIIEEITALDLFEDRVIRNQVSPTEFVRRIAILKQKERRMRNLIAKELARATTGTKLLDHF